MASALTTTAKSSGILVAIKEFGREWVRATIARGVTRTAPGSIKYLLFGESASRQSISIKFGKFGEALMMDIINKSQDLELLKTGVQELAGRSKKIDVDLIWKDKKNPEIIYFRELKGNVNFDTTNLPAVIARTNKLIEDLRVQYPGYTIDGGILHWSVYQRAALHSTTILRAIQSFEREGIKIQHMGDVLETIGFEWVEDDFYTYMRELGTMVASSLNNS